MMSWLPGKEPKKPAEAKKPEPEQVVNA